MTPRSLTASLSAAATHLERAVDAPCHGDCRWSVADAAGYVATALHDLGMHRDAERLERMILRMKAVKKA